MRHASSGRRLTPGPLVFISVALAAVFWVLDSLMDVYVFDEGATLSETLLPAEPMETWMRSILAFLSLRLASMPST